MNYATEFWALAGAEDVFSALHRYKITGDPKRFFPARLVRWNFRVLTDHALGIGATYDWQIYLLGIPVLVFSEQVVEWQAGERVAYRAISGWRMFFRVCLEPYNEHTLVKVNIDISFGHPLFDKMLRPFIEWGLGKVCRHGLGKEGLKTYHRSVWRRAQKVNS